jgi:hypothetical protein
MSEILAWGWLSAIAAVVLWFMIRRMDRHMWEGAAWGLGIAAAWGVTLVALLKVAS